MKVTSQIYESEGQVSQNIGDVVFLIVGIGVAVLVLIFVGVLGGSVFQQVEPDIDALTGTVTNNTFTALNGTAVGLGHDVIQGGTLVITNTTGTVIPLTQFNINYLQGTATLLNNSYNNTLMNTTFDWGNVTIQGHIRESIVSGFSALETTGSYTPIIVLAVIIFLVLGIVMGLGLLGGTSTGGARYSGAL